MFYYDHITNKVFILVLHQVPHSSNRSFAETPLQIKNIEDKNSTCQVCAGIQCML